MLITYLFSQWAFFSSNCQVLFSILIRTVTFVSNFCFFLLTIGPEEVLSVNLCTYRISYWNCTISENIDKNPMYAVWFWGDICSYGLSQEAVRCIMIFSDITKFIFWFSIIFVWVRFIHCKSWLVDWGSI